LGQGTFFASHERLKISHEVTVDIHICSQYDASKRFAEMSTRIWPIQELPKAMMPHCLYQEGVVHLFKS
jgi:hypothetical protein